MRTIIAGSRTITQYSALLEALEFADWEMTHIISGMARGVDSLGERYARENKIRLSGYRALWEEHGKRAGYLRNVQMAESADACVIVWDGKSRGTRHMIRVAQEHGLQIVVYKPGSQGAWRWIPHKRHSG